MLPPVPSPFPDFNVMILPAGAELHRVHSPAFPPDSFNPCMGDPTRFAPLRDAHGNCIPTLYAASTLSCAAYETIFHEVPFGSTQKVVPRKRATGVWHSQIRLNADLTVAALFAPDLHKIGVAREDLVDTSADQYGATALWAAAMYRNNPAISGLAWTSRRDDPNVAYVFFEDRVPAGTLTVVATRTQASRLLDEIIEFGERAGIVLSI